MNPEKWIITENDIFYFKKCENDGIVFTPYIEMAHIFDNEESAQDIMDIIVKGGGFVDDRGVRTYVSAFKVRPITDGETVLLKSRSKTKVYLYADMVNKN